MTSERETRECLICERAVPVRAGAAKRGMMCEDCSVCFCGSGRAPYLCHGVSRSCAEHLGFQAPRPAEGPSERNPAAGLEAEDFAKPQMLADAELGAALRAALDSVRECRTVLMNMSPVTDDEASIDFHRASLHAEWSIALYGMDPEVHGNLHDLVRPKLDALRAALSPSAPTRTPDNDK